MMNKAITALIERLRRRDANTAFAETELRTTVPAALELLDQRLRLLEGEHALPTHLRTDFRERGAEPGGQE